MVLTFLSTSKVSSFFPHLPTITYIMSSIPTIHPLHYALIHAQLRYELSLESPYLALLFSREHPHLSAHYFALDTMDLSVPHTICSTISSNLATLLAIAEAHSDVRLQDLDGISYLLDAIAQLPLSVPKTSKKKATPKRKPARNDGRRKAARIRLEVEEAIRMPMEVEDDYSSDDVPLSQLHPPIQHPPSHDPESDNDTTDVGGQRRYNSRWEIVDAPREAPKPVRKLIVGLSVLRNEDSMRQLTSLKHLLSSTQTSDAASLSLLDLANKCVVTNDHIAEHSYIHMHTLLQFVVCVNQ